MKTHFLQNFHELRGYIEAKQAENDELGRIVEQINERAKKKKNWKRRVSSAADVQMTLPQYLWRSKLKKNAQTLIKTRKVRK